MLCVDGWDRVGRDSVGMLREPAATEMVKGGFDDDFSEPLVVLQSAGVPSRPSGRKPHCGFPHRLDPTVKLRYNILMQSLSLWMYTSVAIDHSIIDQEAQLSKAGIQTGSRIIAPVPKFLPSRTSLMALT